MTLPTLPILTAPHLILRQKAHPVERANRQLSKLIADLHETLRNSHIPGLGLAAPQVGKPLRIFVLNSELNSPHSSSDSSFSHSDRQHFINPEITWSSKKLNVDKVNEENLHLEGCLSIPRIYALIKRPWAVNLKYQILDPSSLNLESKISNFSGFNATLVQHEIDHLNGILFTDHALSQGADIYEIGEDEKLHPMVL